MRNHITRLMRILGASAIALTITTTPSRADEIDGTGANCPQRAFCLYGKTNFEGRMLVFREGVHNLDAYGFRDNAESWVNNTSYSVKLTDVHSFRPDNNTTVGRGARSKDMGSWKNRVDRISILR